MKLNWNFISKIFARTVGVENLSRDAEGHEVLSADQRKILEQKFGPEALQHYDAYAASDANDDAQQEQLLLNFLDAIGRSGGDDKDKLRQELAKAEEKIASMSAQMTILQQEKEKLAKAREDKPAATEVFGRSEGRTFTIDAKASHNRLALEALATGQLPTFSAATIDVDDLKKELGTYSSQGNSLELMQDIYRGFTSAKFMTPKRAIETYKAVRSTIRPSYRSSRPSGLRLAMHGSLPSKSRITGTRSTLRSSRPTSPTRGCCRSTTSVCPPIRCRSHATSCRRFCCRRSFRTSR